MSSSPLAAGPPTTPCRVLVVDDDRRVRELLQVTLTTQGFEVLTDCLSVKFDAPGRKGKPRYRLVYRNEPDEGAIAVVCVLAVGERKQMTAYKQARARLRARLRSTE